MMPASGGWPVTVFHTVWYRHPATRYQSGRSIVAARASTPVSVRLRLSAATKWATWSSIGSRPGCMLRFYHRAAGSGLPWWVVVRCDLVAFGPGCGTAVRVPWLAADTGTLVQSERLMVEPGRRRPEPAADDRSGQGEQAGGGRP